MSIQQPASDGLLSAFDHARMHRVLAVDEAATEQSISVAANADVTLLGALVLGAKSLTINSVEIVGSDGQVNKAAVESSSNWDTAYGWGNHASGGYVVAPANNTADKVPQWNGADSKTLKDGLAVGTGANNLVQLDGDSKLPAVDGSQLTNLPSSGKIVQIVNTQTGAVATGTTLTPIDDTIPQKTEGDEYMSLAITPTSATNKLKIDIVVVFHCVRQITFHLHQDDNNDAIAVASRDRGATSDEPNTIAFTHYMVAGTTSATTFKLRAGLQASDTMTFNGYNGNRMWAGECASSITITEIEA